MLITEYHSKILEHPRRREAIKNVINALKLFSKDVSIVCTGLSGILVGVPAADKTNRNFCIVRKRKEERHSSCTLEGFTPLLEAGYVIVDDFIDSGETINYIWRWLKKEDCKGIILYYSNAKHHDFNGVPVLCV